jgi:hypothetical protein
MENKSVTQLLDKLILSIDDKNKFRKLSPEQKAMAALEFFLTTTTRSGAQTFFCTDNSYLYADVEKGFELLNTSAGLQQYKQMLSMATSAGSHEKDYAELQEEIISKLFTVINPAKEQYIKKNFDTLSQQL